MGKGVLKCMTITSRTSKEEGTAAERAGVDCPSSLSSF